MVGVVIIFLLWVRHNIPRMVDLKWLAAGGGILKKGVHPAAGKFNAGQKFIFWAAVLLGISISLSGLALLFPFQFRSEEHTSELQSLMRISYAVFCLKKKK